MRLTMLELKVSDWPAAVAWYRTALGLKVLLRVEEDGYALLDAGPLKLALKRAEAAGPPSALLLFEVADLDAQRQRLLALGVTEQGPPMDSGENHRRWTFTGFEGQRVCLYEWNTAS